MECTFWFVYQWVFRIVICYSMFLIYYFFHKVFEESFGEVVVHTPPEELQRPITLGFFYLTFLSLATYALFMLGVYRVDTRLMLPWTLVIGIKCVAAGALLCFLSYYITAWQLFQGMLYYAALILCFMAIYRSYIRTMAIRIVAIKIAERMMFPEKISVITVPDEKPKTIV